MIRNIVNILIMVYNGYKTINLIKLQLSFDHIHCFIIKIERKMLMRADELKMISIVQHFPDDRIDNISQITREEIERSGVKFQKGSRIAITAGSRGISNIATIIKAIVDHVRSQGAYPFIIPAMGSHGGATAQGQRKVLEHYGITEETMGVPIVSSMDVVSIPSD
mgnify:CR=1 FL=1